MHVHQDEERMGENAVQQCNQSIYTIDGAGEDESPLITVKSSGRRVSYFFYLKIFYSFFIR